jgi:dihydrofolate reductase
MTKVRSSFSMSLDGFSAGPNQSLEEPLGVGGERLHDWFVSLAVFAEIQGEENPQGDVNASTDVVRGWTQNIGAYVMGRKMFGGGPGPWQGDWRGWWGDNPPYHTPVFVLTHHPREPLEMEGGTTFHFVTDGIEDALERATAAAEGKDVWIGGGASVFRQYLQAGLVDEFEVALVPIFLGDGERPFADQGPSAIRLEQTRAVEAPGVTHIRYRVARAG